MSAAAQINQGLDFLRTRDTIDNEETSYQQLTQCIVGIMNMYWTEKNNNINIGSEVAIFYAPFFCNGIWKYLLNILYHSYYFVIYISYFLCRRRKPEMNG